MGASSEPASLVRGLLTGPRAVVCSILVLMGSSVVTVLLAARVLSSSEYTVYAAFSGILGILVLGPAGSLEQGGVLRARASARRVPVRELLGVWIVVGVVCVAPLGWQQRLLDPETAVALGALVLGAPGVLLLGVYRGGAVARGAFGLAASAHLLAGGATLATPFLLMGIGVPPLRSFLLGAVLAWAPALLLMAAAERSRSASSESGDAGRRGSGGGTRSTAWVVVCNLLVLANLLAVAPLLRWHVESLGAALAADTQLLVSTSRLASALVLGVLPLIMHQSAEGWTRTQLQMVGGAALLGAAAVAGGGLLGAPLISVLTERESELSLGLGALASSSVLALCPAVALMGIALVRGRYVLVVSAWSLGALVLAASALLDPGGEVEIVLAGVLLAGIVPLVVLAVGLVAPTPARRRIQA